MSCLFKQTNLDYIISLIPFYILLDEINLFLNEKDVEFQSLKYKKVVLMFNLA